MPPDPTKAPPAPSTVRRAGVVVAVQGAICVVFGVAIAIAASAQSGALARAGYGTAGYFVPVGLAIVAVGVALVRGRRGARAPAIVVQVLLLGASWYLLQGSQQPLAGLVVAAVSILVIALLVGRSTSDWVAAQYVPPLSEPGTEPPGLAEVRARQEREQSQPPQTERRRARED